MSFGAIDVQAKAIKSSFFSHSTRTDSNYYLYQALPPSTHSSFTDNQSSSSSCPPPFPETRRNMTRMMLQFHYQARYLPPLCITEVTKEDLKYLLHL